MKEITIEVRSKIFSLYYGQFIGVEIERTEEGRHVLIGNIIQTTDYIVVKPLSSITDEDAAECNKEVLKMTSDLTRGEIMAILVTVFCIDVVVGSDTLMRQFKVSEFISLCDFLRSKGYALPAFGHSVEQLIAANIFKLTT